MKDTARSLRTLATDGPDFIDGSSGLRTQTIFGLDGNDTLISGARKDVIFGGAGDDLILPGGVGDQIFGGPGDDVVQVSGSVTDASWRTVGATDRTFLDTPEGRLFLHGVEAVYFEADDYTLFLDGTNNAPLAVDDTATTDEDTVLVIDAAGLIANDLEFEGDPLSLTAVDATSAAGASVSLVNGQVIYDPGTVFQSLGVGDVATDTFTYVVDDGQGGSDTGTVTVTIDGRNDAPQLLAVTGICIVEGTLTVNPVAGAEDAEGDILSYFISGGDDAALFEIDAVTGALTFLAAPDAEAPADDGGDNTYEVEITVEDGNGGSDSALVSITVEAEPDPGTFGAPAFALVESTSQNLLSFETDAPVFTSPGDFFGVTDISQTVPFALLDDSAGVFPPDSLGIIDSNANPFEFFGIVDTINGDNADSDPYTATWVFSIQSLTDLELSIDVGAMGDFEGNDVFDISYSIDGGAVTPLWSFRADEAASLTYTLANGLDFTLNDPMVEQTTGTTLSNQLTTLTAAIAGSGSTLELYATGSFNGGSEALAIQNIFVDGTNGGPGVVAYDLVGSDSLNLETTENTAPPFSSLGDGFGIYQVWVSPTIPFSLLDDSGGIFSPDRLGIIDSATNFGRFFGVTDTVNSDTTGPVSHVWGFDVAGASNLSLSVDAGAMGDFESNDTFTISYNFDGGPETVLFDFVADEAAAQTYTLASGTVVDLDDPLVETGSGIVLSNVLQTISGALTGSGSTLNVTLTAQTDGGSESFALQNLIVETAGTGPVDGSTYAVTALDGDQFEGDAGTTIHRFEITRTGDLSEPGSVDVTIAGDVDSRDLTSPMSGTVTFVAGQSCAVIEVEVAGDEIVETDETIEVTLSAPVGGDIGNGVASTQVLDDDTLTLISTVQGSLEVSNYQGQIVAVEGVVTHVVGNGFYLQEEDADADGDAATSEGIFVFTSDDYTVTVGDLVLVRGEVDEFFGLTQITNVDNLETVSSGNDLPEAVQVFLGPDAEQDFESIEGMRFELQSGVAGAPITVIENFQLGRFGEIVVSAGAQYQPTQLYDAQTQAADIARLTEENATNRLIIDDGRTDQNPDEFRYIAASVGDNGNGYLDYLDTFTAEGPTLRLGAEFDGAATGVMSFGFGEWRMLVEGTLPIDEATNTGAREATPAAVGGDIQLASINVLNFFTTLSGGSGPNGLNPRGADSLSELERQTDKLVAAILGSGAEIVALQEIENGGFGPGSAIATLVDALNTQAALEGSGSVWAFVDPTGGAPGGFIGTDAITTGLIYDSSAANVTASDVLTFAESASDATSALADVLNPVVPLSERLDDLQRNRPAVAATFQAIDGDGAPLGDAFTVVSNHFKSKGDSNLEDLAIAAQEYLDGGGTAITQADVDALRADSNFDQGDGQGFWNGVRAEAAAELAQWIATDYAGTGTDNFVILGDLNAYAQEDPVQALSQDAGLVDLIDSFIGQDVAYSFVFDGQRGTLDQALAAADFAANVTGVTEWHINADEPSLLNYDESFNNPAFYEPSVFAASDHDPLILGLDLGGVDIPILG